MWFSNNLCKCTEISPILLTNTSIKWDLDLSLSNHLVTSFRLEMNVGGFSKQQNNLSDTDRNKGYFFIDRVSQVNVKITKRIFEQWSELLVAKCLIVHVLSSLFLMSLALSYEIKEKHCCNGNCVSPTLLYSIRSLYVMKEGMRTML